MENSKRRQFHLRGGVARPQYADQRAGRTIALALPLLAASVIALGLAFTLPTPARALAETAKPACSGISHIVVLGKEPVQVNPGAKCEMTLGLLVSRAGERACINVREVGKKATLGPICTSGPTERMQGAIEWAWSADRPLRAYVILTPPRTAPKSR